MNTIPAPLGGGGHVSTPKLDQIAAHGNRGHHHPTRPDSTITCADGYRLSVIAGAGTYCHPRPSLCTCAWLPNSTPGPAFPWKKPCNYPGPYSHVEVMILDGETRKHPKGWKRYNAGGFYASVPVETVRDLIAAHGGER